MKKSGKVITVMNMKGGVGKTTVTAHLSATIADSQVNEKYKQILVIDYDPQFNLSQALLSGDDYLKAQKENKNILSVLCDDNEHLNLCQLQEPESPKSPRLEDITYNVFTKNGNQRLDIVTSTLELIPLTVSSSEKSQKIMELRFQDFIKKAKNRYDLILIDCHPAGSLLTKTSLKSSDHVLIPVSPHNYAARGVALMFELISSLFKGESEPSKNILFNNIKPEDKAFILKLTKQRDLKKISLNTYLKNSKIYCDLIDGQGFLHESTKPYYTDAYKKILDISEEILSKI